MTKTFLLAGAGLLFLAACGNNPTDRALSGAGIGAAAGTVGGALVGSPVTGAVVGVTADPTTVNAPDSESVPCVAVATLLPSAKPAVETTMEKLPLASVVALTVPLPNVMVSVQLGAHPEPLIVTLPPWTTVVGVTVMVALGL